jgi:aminomethyltransferase
LEEIYDINLDELYFLDNKTLDDKTELSRCGYTGEDGFELYLDIDRGRELYQQLIDYGVQLGGLMERDILRLEAGLCLSGSEFGGDMGIHFGETDKHNPTSQTQYISLH